MTIIVQREREETGYTGIKLLDFIKIKSVISWSWLWNVGLHIAIPRAEIKKIVTTNVV